MLGGLCTLRKEPEETAHVEFEGEGGHTDSHRGSQGNHYNCQLMPLQKSNFDILELRFTRQEEMFE